MTANSKVAKLQLLQQNLQNLLFQKQQVETSLIEINSSSEEVSKTNKAYRIIGKIMVASAPKEILADLQQKKEVAELRLKNLLKQEENIKMSMEFLQQEAVQELQSKK